MAAEKIKADPDDTKKSKKDKWMHFFSLSNPDLWIALGVIALVIILVCSPARSVRLRTCPLGVCKSVLAHTCMQANSAEALWRCRGGTLATKFSTPS